MHVYVGVAAKPRDCTMAIWHETLEKQSIQVDPTHEVFVDCGYPAKC